MDAKEQIRSWFKDEELRVCPECGNRSLVPSLPDQAYDYCIDCGPVIPPPATS